MPDTPPPILYKYMSEQHRDFFTKRQMSAIPLGKLNILFDYAVGFSGIVNPTYIEEKIITKRDSYLDDKFSPPQKEEKGFLNSLKRFFYPAVKEALQQLSQPSVKNMATNMAIEYNLKRLPQTITDIKKEFYNINIISFTSQIDSPAIWTNCALSCSTPPLSGFMVGLDTSHSFFQSKKNTMSRLQGVNYPLDQDKWYFSDFFDNCDSGENKYPFVLYTKNHSFSYEHEWRLGIASASNSPDKHETVPIDAIKAIHLGSRAGSDLTKDAFAFCSQHGVPLFRMTPTLQGTLFPELILIP